MKVFGKMIWGVSALAAIALFALPNHAAAEEPACYECHDELPEVSSPHDPVAEGDCEACHEDHGDDEELRLVEEGSALCFQCHDEMGGDDVTMHPPAEDGECTECHNPHGSDNGGLLIADTSELCFECHESHGFEDPVAHAAIEDGCTECHNPHASEHPKLLVAELSMERQEIFEERQAELCFNCHDSDALTAKETEDTEFRNGTQNLHAFHLTGGARPNKYGILKKKAGQTCVGCHLPHSALQERLIRMEFECRDVFCYTMRFQPNDVGGKCVVGCHKPKSYSREAADKRSTARVSGTVELTSTSTP